MNRDKEIELLSQCLRLTEAGRPPKGADETLVPVAKYRDNATFERERERLFRRQLNVVAHQSEIAAPGDFITRDVVGQPVIVVRDEAGRARAFLNVCRHRGATVELREQGHCKRFVCPYHAWTYGTDGRLAAVRHRAGFPSLSLDETGLIELPCRERAGLIWVCPEPNANIEPDGAGPDDAGPDDAGASLLEELTGLGCAEGTVFASETRIWRTNWKLIVDGGLESYHFRIAHRGTVGPFFADNISIFELLGDHIRTVLPRTDIVKLNERPHEQWSIRKQAHLVYALFPNATVLIQEGHFDLILLAPLSPEETRITVSSIVPKPGPDGYSDKARTFWSANHAFTQKTLNEDFSIAEQIQRGMHTGANTHFRFAHFEGALTRWHQLIDQKLSDEPVSDGRAGMMAADE